MSLRGTHQWSRPRKRRPATRGRKQGDNSSWYLATLVFFYPCGNPEAMLLELVAVNLPRVAATPSERAAAALTLATHQLLSSCHLSLLLFPLALLLENGEKETKWHSHSTLRDKWHKTASALFSHGRAGPLEFGTIAVYYRIDWHSGYHFASIWVHKSRGC